MGMFDTVTIEGLKLPKLPKEVSYFLKDDKTLLEEFQTKDLDNLLSTFTINSKGQIFVIEYRPTGKKIPHELPFIGWKDNRSFLERIYFKLRERQTIKKYPKLKTIDERKPVKVKSKITSTFNIYNNKEINGRYVEVEFSVVAINGKVKKIILINANLEKEKEAKERHLQNEKFDKKMAESFQRRNKLKSSWYYPLIKEIYNPFVFFSSKIVQSVCNKILALSYRWHGV